MAPKQVKTVIKLQCPAGKANPAPPVGPALGQHGVNIQEFCTKFNEDTKDKGDTIIPVEITVYVDSTFTFITKTPPAAVLIRKMANIPKGSGVPHKDKVGTLTEAQVEEIAREKMPDLNAHDIEAAKMIIKGTARSMGVVVK